MDGEDARTDERTNGRTHTHDFLKLSTQKPLRGNYLTRFHQQGRVGPKELLWMDYAGHV